MFLINYLVSAALGLHWFAQAFSHCSKWGLLFIAAHVLLIVVASLVGRSIGSRRVDFSSCTTPGQELLHAGSRMHGLSSCGGMGLVAPQHVESSQTRDQTHVPCIGRQILYHWTTREFPDDLFLESTNFGKLCHVRCWEYSE